MVEMFPLKSADAAYGKISGMIATLGDPFTRIISPKVTPTPKKHYYRSVFLLSFMVPLHQFCTRLPGVLEPF
jgi:hypothetical protein